MTDPVFDNLIQALSTEAAGEALSALCPLAKTKAGREQIEAALGDHALLHTLLLQESPKVRKNTYRLLGALQNPVDAAPLCRALETETTLFAVPSLLLALGALGQKDALFGYTLPASTGPETDKHIAAITAAYQKATEQFMTAPRETVSRLAAAREIRCYAPRGFEKELLAELDALGFTGTIQSGAVRIITADIARVMKADCLVEALLPIAAEVPLDPVSIAKAAGKCIGSRYRIELRGYLKDRAKFIERLKTRLDGINSPSNYDCELRIECRNTTADLFWKLWNVPDERYPWRAGTIPASMHPATASALAWHLKGLLNGKRVSVMDPFCGSGTLLFCMERVCAIKSLLGVDQSGKAVEIARKNARAGESKARFVCRDILRFTAKQGADVVISNLPFGNRVGSHKDNERLYAAFVHKLRYLVADGGTALLYTADGKLMERLLQNEKNVERIETLRTEAGGLQPWIFIVKKRQIKPTE